MDNERVAKELVNIAKNLMSHNWSGQYQIAISDDISLPYRKWEFNRGYVKAPTLKSAAYTFMHKRYNGKAGDVVKSFKGDNSTVFEFENGMFVAVSV